MSYHHWNLLQEYVKLYDYDLKGREFIDYLFYELPYMWFESYQQNCDRLNDVCTFRFGSFDYIYDDTSALERQGKIPLDAGVAARVVVAYGRSTPLRKKREAYRLRKWLGPTNSTLGDIWDKGHFIAHSIGGSIDGTEVNIFRQRRDLNRGISEHGKVFREMENYCYKHPGTFCFNRPIYLDQTANPAFYEFGILKEDGKLWVESFDNREHIIV